MTFSPMLRCLELGHQEWLYREEFEQYEQEGVLQMHTAFSREQAVAQWHRQWASEIHSHDFYLKFFCF